MYGGWSKQINLDNRFYGTLAEIGAGQEVARRFFHVGGASGTIAKTMSAYDMTFSDAIYGPTARYVSRVRLGTMLDHEYKLLIERLDQTLGAQRLFFVFADTVAARSFKQHNEAHGWLGIRFQTDFRGEPSQIIIHVRMLDEGNVEQQEALGVIGVNLIYGAFYHTRPEELISSLQENLAPGRIEVDMIKFSGPAFAQVDNRLMSLQLVSQGLTDAVMFRADGETVQPAEVFYKQAILVERGSFRPVTYATNDWGTGSGGFTASVTVNAPPHPPGTPMSSPRQKTRSSRCISSLSAWPSAGPTGGAGVASPAGIWSFT